MAVKTRKVSVIAPRFVVVCDVPYIGQAARPVPAEKAHGRGNCAVAKGRQAKRTGIACPDDPATASFAWRFSALRARLRSRKAVRLWSDTMLPGKPDDIIVE